MNTIPRLIDYVSPSEAAICMHEAGHAAGALMVGVAPAFIEFVEDPTSVGLARNRIPFRTQSERKTIGCAAFAVEYKLFREGRLTDIKGEVISESQFIQISLGTNAHEDKVLFFGANHEQKNLNWPKAYDEAFKNRGIEIASSISMHLVTEIAQALLTERYLSCTRIVEIGAKHLPALASQWVCPDVDKEDT